MSLLRLQSQKQNGYHPPRFALPEVRDHRCALAEAEMLENIETLICVERCVSAAAGQSRPLLSHAAFRPRRPLQTLVRRHIECRCLVTLQYPGSGDVGRGIVQIRKQGRTVHTEPEELVSNA